MKFNKWTLTLAAAGVVSLGSVAQGEEAKNQVLTALSSTTLSGYVGTSAIWKLGTGNTFMPGRAYDGPAKQDGFNLNVIKLTLEKPLDEGQWSAGYKVDLLFGPDATYFKSFSGGGPASQDFAVQQAYVNLRAPVGNGLDFKMGVFDSIIGYESFDSYKNPNYSRSYGYAMTPRTHTGLLATYQVAEWMSLMAGVADTTFGTVNERALRPSGFATESEKTYMAGLVLTAPESFGAMKGAALYAGVVNGLNGATSPAISPTDITCWYAGVSVPTPLTGLSVGASYNYTGNTASGAGFARSSFYANASSLYLTYQATEKLKFANRFEYATSTLGDVMGETFTLDYSLWANVITRAEFRWDHDLNSQNIFGGVAGLNQQKNAYSLALNVIYKF
jgi:hypothetical protein